MKTKYLFISLFALAACCDSDDEEQERDPSGERGHGRHHSNRHATPIERGHTTCASRSSATLANCLRFSTSCSGACTTTVPAVS